MHIVWLLIPALVFLIEGFSALSSGADDSMWELRWRSLDDRDQARIAAAGRTKGSRAELEERDELELAEGFNRRERRRRAYLQLPLLLGIVALFIFTLLGVLPGSDLDQVFAYAAMLVPVTAWLRDWQIKRAHRPAPDPSSACRSPSTVSSKRPSTTSAGIGSTRITAPPRSWIPPPSSDA